MGLPTSWALLSIIHLWWGAEAAKTSPRGELRRAHRLAICGDDALFATTVAGATRYNELVEKCGGALSKGKHF